MNITPATALDALPFLLAKGKGKRGEAVAKKIRDGLDALGLRTVEDLLRHYPRRH